jgi:UDP-2,3-diacylglucosamine pyrophosphatase LpxH
LIKIPAFAKFSRSFYPKLTIVWKNEGMQEVIYDIVILSDLHLGSDVSRASEALDLLRSISFRRLILLGDIFCDLNFRRLNKEHWQFLSFIRKLSNPKRNVQVIWVEGNHDYGLTNVMSHLVGVPVYQEYVWESQDGRNIAIHGHQFDNFIIKNHIFMNGLASQLYLFIQKLSSKGKLVARLLDRLNTCWQRLTPKVAEGALSYARAHGAKRIFCGHSHEAVAIMRNGVSYYNTGSWANRRCTYVTISEQEVLLNEHSGRIVDRYPCEKRGEIAASSSDLVIEAGLPSYLEHENIPG